MTILYKLSRLRRAKWYPALQAQWKGQRI